MRIADDLLDEDGRIDLDRWLSAGLTQVPVGTCHCGSPLRVDDGTSAFGKTFLAVSCLLGGHEAAIPRGRVLRPAKKTLMHVGVSESVLAAGRARDAAILGERD